MTHPPYQYQPLPGSNSAVSTNMQPQPSSPMWQTAVGATGGALAGHHLWGKLHPGRGARLMGGAMTGLIGGTMLPQLMPSNMRQQRTNDMQYLNRSRSMDQYHGLPNLQKQSSRIGPLSRLRQLASGGYDRVVRGVVPPETDQIVRNFQVHADREQLSTLRQARNRAINQRKSILSDPAESAEALAQAQALEARILRSAQDAISFDSVSGGPALPDVVRGRIARRALSDPSRVPTHVEFVTDRRIERTRPGLFRRGSERVTETPSVRVTYRQGDPETFTLPSETSALKDLPAQAGTTLQKAAVLPLTLGGIYALGAGLSQAESAKDAVMEGRRFNKAMDVLRQVAPADVNDVGEQDLRRTFKVLNNYAPDVAKDPLLGAEYLRREVTLGGFDPNPEMYLQRVQTATDLEGMIQRNRQNPIQAGMAALASRLI